MDMNNESVSAADASQKSSDIQAELDAFKQVVEAMQGLGHQSRVKLINMASTLFGLSLHISAPGYPSPAAAPVGSSASAAPASSFSEDRTISPKEFILQKKPTSDVDRVATLAYYLTHYRDTPEFKTLDLSKLNTEAAQLKFSNAAYAVENAFKSGLLIQGSKGTKRISAAGELYVQQLPDRRAAKDAIAHLRRRKTKRGSTSSRSNGNSERSDESGEE